MNNLDEYTKWLGRNVTDFKHWELLSLQEDLALNHDSSGHLQTLKDIVKTELLRRG